MKKITPKLLKGFRDFSPKQNIKRVLCIKVLREAFETQGFHEMDTPILEYADVLLGKGGGETDKQVYKFQDAGKRDVVMRFDLTVPFARFVSMNKNTLPIPFFRSQIGKVFRGENTQKGRYREFMQCDFDIIGLDYASLDFTILQTIIVSFQALNMKDIKIHISHRGILNEFLSQKQTEAPNKAGLSSELVCIETLRIIDKLRKIGSEKTRTLLLQFWNDAITNSIMSLVERESNNESTLEKLSKAMPTNSKSMERLQAIYTIAKDTGFEKFIIIDPSITRGLDYYTGFVCETFVDGYEDMGSVCSGGRYNNLTQMFDEEQCPGVGASIGLDRLLAVLDDQQSLTEYSSRIKIVIMVQVPDALSYAHTVQNKFQQKGFSAIVYPISGTMKQFFKYTEKVHADVVCIIGSDELENKTITMKNQATREQKNKISIESAIGWMNNITS